MPRGAAGRIVPPQSPDYSDRSNRGMLRRELDKGVAIAGRTRSRGGNDSRELKGPERGSSTNAPYVGAREGNTRRGLG